MASEVAVEAIAAAPSPKAVPVSAHRRPAVVDVSLEEATAELKTVPEDWYAVAKAFFG